MYISTIILAGALFAWIYFLGRSSFVRLFVGIIAGTLIIDNAPFVANIAKQFLTAETRAYVYIVSLAIASILCAWAFGFHSYARMGFATRVIAALAGTVTLSGLIIAIGNHLMPFASTFSTPSGLGFLFTNPYAIPGWILANLLVFVIAYKS